MHACCKRIHQTTTTTTITYLLLVTLIVFLPLHLLLLLPFPFALPCVSHIRDLSCFTMFLSKIRDTAHTPAASPSSSITFLPAHSNMDNLSPPVQLDLLPLLPVASPPPRYTSSNTSLSWLPQQRLARDIDMNRIPSADLEESMTSPQSIVSPFNLESSACPEFSLFKRDKEDTQEAYMERSKNQESSSRNSDEEDGGGARKKLRLTKEQSALLEDSFKEHNTLNPKQKNALAKQLNLRPRQVEVWFQNRRARTKLKQTEVDCELLKRCCETLTEENRRLQKELQELRAIKVAPPCVITHDFFMPLPAATLTMCPSCEKIATMDLSRPVAYPRSQYHSQFRQPSAAC